MEQINKNRMPALERIVVPPAQKAMGSVIWLHGLGADAHDSVGVVKAIRLPETLHLRYILPHAPVRPVTVNQNLPMRAWYDVYSFEALDKEDMHGIHEAETLINTLIDEEIAQGIPSERIIVAGFSQGGAMALRAGLCHTKPLGGVMALSTYLPLANQLHEDCNTNHKPPVFIGHGLFDAVLPVVLGQAFHKQLQSLGYSTEWHDYPIEHQVSEAELSDIGRWLTSRFM